MPYIQIDWIEGRTREQKAQIVKEFTDTMARVTGVDPAVVHFIFNDHPKDDFANEGKLLSELMGSADTVKT